MESELDLLNETIGNVYFLERLRFSVHEDIATRTGLMDATPRDGDGVSGYLAGSWLFARNTLVRNPFLAPNSDLLFY